MLKTITPSTPMLIEDLGMQFATEKSKNKFRRGIFKCSCGNQFNAVIAQIKNGGIKSCGCYKIQRTIETNIKNKTIHGLRGNPIYGTWVMMLYRTNNKNSRCFNNYGGRGITVCERWKNPANFIEDMYPTYKEGLTIDRIDVNGNYEHSNCRWADIYTQAQNKRAIQHNNTSGYRGASWSKIHNIWLARISIEGSRKVLGYFKTALEAAKAYDNYVINNNLEHPINGVI